ncbi:MAG TPA: hypothetical protein VFG52_08745 [Xanthomonadales bacterium]|nr:hypothetical protein [Xanthomonadales bacterium]
MKAGLPGVFARPAAVLLAGLLLVMSSSSPAQVAKTAQQETDEIWSLLAMAIAFKDWQQSTERGHNIAALLVDPAGQPVFWARNDRFATDNGTDHSEVQVMRQFLDCPHRLQYLGAPPPGYPGAKPGKGFTLYTTLEPCVMCTGMMLMNHLTRAVYVQSDPDYGQVQARLKAAEQAGFAPYPVSLEISRADIPEAAQLDLAYARLNRKDVIIPFLRSPIAREVYAEASERLRQYQSQYDQQALVEVAQNYLDNVVDTGRPSDPLEECPP